MRARTIWLLASLLLISVDRSALLQAQQTGSPEPGQPPVTFRAEVNYVEVDAVVTDAKGNLVAGLTQDDFSVFEDGKPQKISTFGLVNIPVTRPDQPLFSPSPIELEVQTNEHRDGRVYMIVLDSLHTDALNALRVKAAARQFVERRLGENDVAAVVHTSGRSDLGQDFTNNRRLLLASIDKFVGEKLRSETLEKLDAYSRTGITVPSSPVGGGQTVMDPEELERGDHAKRMLRQLQRLADYMAGIHGRRKALVLISEGVPYDMANLFGTAVTSIVLDEAREAIGAAQRANVSIYAIDPRGLSTGMGDAIEIAGFDSAVSTDSGTTHTDSRALGIGPEALMSESRIAQDSLRMLAEETGGIAAVNRNDFKNAFEQIVKENSTYYVLGYYPTNEKRDGKFHKIDVKVKRAGVTVKTRRGYVAPRGKAVEVKATPDVSPVLREAMNSPIPMGVIPLRAFAAAFKGTAPNATVALSVEMGGSDFKYAEKNGGFSDVVTVVFTPIDQNGKVKAGKRSKATLALKAPGVEAARTNGIRVLSSLDLPPAHYQIRIAVGEDGAEKAGTVLYDLDVPDFSKLPVAMSGIVVSAASAGTVVTVGSEGPIAQLLPGPAVATREFARGDTLGLFAEVYENLPQAPTHKVDLTTTVRADDGHAVFSTQEERSSTELQGGRGGYGYTPQIPLKDLVPGTYVIHLEARSRTSNQPGIGRDIQIRVK
jgi:VWFA-related protein